MDKDDLTAITDKWLRPCGSCDGGLSVACTHPDEDYRPFVAALVAEVERLTPVVEAATAWRKTRRGGNATGFFEKIGGLSAAVDALQHTEVAQP